MKKVVITAQDLRDGGACGGQVSLFVRTFGESVELNVDTVRRAVAAGLTVTWPSHDLEIQYEKHLEVQCPGWGDRHYRVVDALYGSDRMCFLGESRSPPLPTLEAWWRSRALAESVAVSDEMCLKIIEAWEDWLHAGCPSNSY